MKRREFQTCILCGKGVMHDGNIIFYRVRIEHMGINVAAVQRAHAFEGIFTAGQRDERGRMMGSMIADAMGTDEDLAVRVGEESTVLLCQSCALGGQALVPIMHEQAGRRHEAHERKGEGDGTTDQDRHQGG